MDDTYFARDIPDFATRSAVQNLLPVFSVNRNITIVLFVRCNRFAETLFHYYSVNPVSPVWFRGKRVKNEIRTFRAVSVRAAVFDMYKSVLRGDESALRNTTATRGYVSTL